ncbi:hypothetical protein DXG01_002172 [Tephrocybe rancida]|nr:hypothetical protein DXG01_002172 [Tephrocybe rancida]
MLGGKETTLSWLKRESADRDVTNNRQPKITDLDPRSIAYVTESSTSFNVILNSRPSHHSNLLPSHLLPTADIPNGQHTMTAIPADSSSSSSVLPHFENTDEELAYLRVELLLLKKQVKDVERVYVAVARGDCTQNIEQGGGVVNGMVDNLKLFVRDVKKLGQEVRTEGTLGGPAQAYNAEGEWREITDVIHKFASIILRSCIREISKVTRGVALGDLSKRVGLQLPHNILIPLSHRLEMMVAEVSRVTREVGTYGKLGGQANVSDVDGDWLALVMNLRGFAQLTASVMDGDFTMFISVEASLELVF